MLDDIKSPEQIKEEFIELLKKEGVEKIEKKDGITYFHLTRRLFDDQHKLRLDDENGDDLGQIGIMISCVLNGESSVYFRSVDAGKGFSRLTSIVDNGIDIPGFSIDEMDRVDLSKHLFHASSYGGIRKRGEIENSRIVLIYDSKKIEHARGEGEGHKYCFIEEPKSQLLGVLLIYCEGDREKGLINV